MKPKPTSDKLSRSHQLKAFFTYQLSLNNRGSSSTQWSRISNKDWVRDIDEVGQVCINGTPLSSRVISKFTVKNSCWANIFEKHSTSSLLCDEAIVAKSAVEDVHSSGVFEIKRLNLDWIGLIKRRRGREGEGGVIMKNVKQYSLTRSKSYLIRLQGQQ